MDQVTIPALIADVREKLAKAEALAHVSWLTPEEKAAQSAAIAAFPLLAAEVERLESELSALREQIAGMAREWRVAYVTQIAGLGWREIVDPCGESEESADWCVQDHMKRPTLYRGIRKESRLVSPWKPEPEKEK